MQYKTFTTEIVGAAPLILNNGQIADPFNMFAKALKPINSKRGKNKTEADLKEISRIKYQASLYLDASGPVVPYHMMEACLIDGARKAKLGKQMQAGTFVERNASLVYSGPRTWEEMFNDERFRFTRLVRIGQQRVPTTRPIFEEWSAEIEIKYLDDLVNDHDILLALRNAGALCGLGDWRPRYGRFNLRMDLQTA